MSHASEEGRKVPERVGLKESRVVPDNEKEFLFFPVQGINVDDFKQNFPMSPKNGTYVYHGQSQVHGKKIIVNEKEVALFCYRNNFYAMDEKCPHLGGPLHLGDIEDLCSHSGANRGPYIVCPWHKWKFELPSGKQVSPPERQEHVNVYPVRTTESGKILIGFSRIDPMYFSTTCDF